MRTLEPGKDPLQWTKECFCTGKGNGNNGCFSKLLVEWVDLYLTSQNGDPRELIHAPSTPKSAEELLKGVNQIFYQGSKPTRSEGPVLFVTFRCHNCQVETDILQISLQEVSDIFYLLPTKREWDQARQKFKKD